MYENIDMKKTGLLLKMAIGNAGYTVKDIQKILHLSVHNLFIVGLRG